ncbi:ABC transporter permease [Maritalea myrionectae]|uniref:ABC transporter permease n=1 Tax=Maritalea myrionectae TaxID=454601 RepID=UPI0004154B57|nr:ABC transporter permease [Maritalea myrionectae]
MIIYLAKRFFQAILVLVVISLIGFAVQDSLSPQQAVGAIQTAQNIEETGFAERYFHFLSGVVQGDLGTSYFFKEPALEVILKKMPATLELMFAAALIVAALSVPFGVFTALYPNHMLSRFILSASILGLSIPVFVTGILLIYLFSVEWSVLPSFGRGQIVPIVGYWETNFASLDGLKHIILPALALASIMLPLFIRLIRAEMRQVLKSEYVKYARARGLSPFRIYFVHALKNTLLPVVTVGGIQIGTLVAYTILAETIFQWPGMGFMFLEAVNRGDAPLIVAYLMVVGAIFVVINTLVDVLYGLINPTIDMARMGA